MTSKQKLLRMPITLAQVKAVNTSQNSLNEVCEIIYSSYRAKGITKKIYKNVMKFNKVIEQNWYYIYEF